MIHQGAAFPQGVAAPIGSFRLVSDEMRQLNFEGILYDTDAFSLSLTPASTASTTLLQACSSHLPTLE